MKLSAYIGMTALILCTSCDKNFLETTATDRYNESNWWQTQDQAISMINGCYAVIRDNQIHGINAGTFSEENITPNSYSFGQESPLDIGNHNAGNVNRFYTKWNVNYRGIGRVNYLLDNIDKIQQIDASIKERIKGEAYFLRALFYANLVNYFGGVPLILEAPNLEKQRSLHRNSRQEVISQILADLDKASAVLPVVYAGANIGRATKGAALALKTRVLLYESRWPEAASTAKEVMELNRYSLFPDYRGLFLPENENNAEVVFDVQFKAPEYPNAADVILELQINLAPTLDLVNSYLMTDGLSIHDSPLYDPEHPYENRDSRLHKTVVIPGYMFRGAIVGETKYFSTGFGFKKYTSYKDNVAQSNITNSEINFMVLRYADVLLMYAEAQNEVSGGDATVYDALNQIRRRVGMPDFNETLSKEELREAIRHERRIELAGEALYYHDIRRWRTAEVVMNAPVLNSKGQVVQTRSFNANRDYLWPIHSITIQDNPSLEQNPGY